MAGILLRLLGPFFTKVDGTNSLKAAGTNFDHFSENFPHGRVDFVVGWSHCFLHGNLGNFGMETQGKLYCYSFSLRVFYLGYLSIWSNLAICRYGCC